MSRTASKLADSVRRARDEQGTEQGGAAETSTETPEETSAETGGEFPEPPPAATPTGGSRSNAHEERPLPRIPSRRVWPD